MRKPGAGKTVSVRAVSGTHVVILGWTVDKAAAKGLLGFAIERAEISNGKEKSLYFLRGIKRFEDKDNGLAPGTPVPTSEHPVQTFQWGDYTARPGTTYRYRVVPARGEPKHITLDDAGAATVQIDTEAESGNTHEIYFNRGVAGSQAYAREFKDAKPDTNDPDSEQMKWLSRGLYEALVAFVGQARNSSWGLRAALYEFHYEPVGRAFKAAIEAGADVQILYDTPNYRKANEDMIQHLDLGAHCKPRGKGGAQKHNKFIILTNKGKPVAVWTGSTNISDGGIFGHSNVGHVVRDLAIARKFLDYWNELDGDPSQKTLTPANNKATPTPKKLPPKSSMTTLFSPRDPATLDWYADAVMNAAKRMVCFTVAFTLADTFKKVLVKESDVLRYVLADKQINGGASISRDQDLVVASGAVFGKNELANFLAEHLTGLNSNLYIHTKFMLVDPLGDDPIVVSGTANFSANSQKNNDENMLVIRGNTRVADIYFGEFMRIFDHLYARYLAKKIQEQHQSGGKGGYLRPDDSWTSAHFGDTPKSRRREYFATGK